jgi:hypothetical protein
MCFRLHKYLKFLNYCKLVHGVLPSVCARALRTPILLGSVTCIARRCAHLAPPIAVSLILPPPTPNGMPFNTFVRFRYNLITVGNLFCTAKNILPVANVGKSSI